MASGELEDVELGFLEKVEDASLLAPPFFPSKVGGRPAWMDLRGIPSPSRMACGNCAKPLVFLLQVYAPQPGANPEAHHRSVFVFMCRDPTCHHQAGLQGAVKVFRSQFGRREGKKETDEEEKETEDEEEEEDEREDEGRSDSTGGCAEPSQAAIHSGHDQVNSCISGTLKAELSSRTNACSLVSEGTAEKSIASPTTGGVRQSDSVGDKISTTDSAVLEPQSSSPDSKRNPTSDGRGMSGNDSSTGGNSTDRKDSSQSSPRMENQLLALCTVCGCCGPLKCGRCKRVTYCSREHQTHDWRAGHKLYCSDMASGRNLDSSDLQYTTGAGILLPEFEIVTEVEPEIPKETMATSEEDRMDEYRRFVASGKYIPVDDGGSKPGKGGRKNTVKTLEMAKSDLASDKVFRAFKRRIAVEPEQVIRYQRGGQPLLVAGEGAPRQENIPNCPHCGAERAFEFQVMPQILYYLKLDSVSEQTVDWGTLMVYTCARSCSSSGPYPEEFVWRQNFSRVNH